MVGPQMASWIIQSAARNTYPMYTAMLNGTGQIVQVSRQLPAPHPPSPLSPPPDLAYLWCVQVADTGLDMSSCFFRDSRGNVATTTWSSASYDLTRRKVVQYVVWADSTDVTRGHGTHVSGE